MRIPELQRILIDAASRQDQQQQHASWIAWPPSASRRLRLGPRPLVLVLGMLLLGGSAAAAVVALTQSRPLSGTVPPGAAPIKTTARTHYSINVFPYLTVGWSGWCTSVNFTTRRLITTVYGCGPVENSGPLVTGEGPFSGGGDTYQYLVVNRRVAAVHYSTGVTITPISSSRLPAGMRAVIYISPSVKAPKPIKPGVPPRHPDLPQFPGPTLLDAHGRIIPIPLVSHTNAVEHLPVRVLNPARPAGGACTVHAHPLPGLVALSQSVTALRPWPRRDRGAFLACANATYRLGSATLAAAVLVNATHPDNEAPPLPDLTADPQHPGILVGHELGSIGLQQGFAEGNFGGNGQPFNSATFPQPLANHNVSARRAGHSWLIVESGTASQRAQLLADLTTRA
jgi:hypothetical protein